MIHILNKIECCGCGACEQRCPRNCIQLKSDGEGFYYPKVELSKCIDCHLCEKVCPIIHQSEFQTIYKPLEVYAIKNRNDTIRLNSSSGGVFFELAKKIIENNGIVFGATFDEKNNVVHKGVEKLDEIRSLMGSKYVQSRIGFCYRLAEEKLKKGKKVLFTGTPCQIAGLYKYLRVDYNNLIAVDIICHGVPSPGVWKRYKINLSDMHHDNIRLINFRVKEHFGWSHYGTKIAGHSEDLYYGLASKNPYMRAFATNNILRPICYECKHKRKSGADITIGDFWGIQTLFPDFYDEKGVSVVIINTEKGRSFFPTNNFEIREADFDSLLRYNISYIKSPSKPLERKKFFKLFQYSNLTIYQIVHKTIPDLSELTILGKILFIPTRLSRFISRKFKNYK